MGLDTSHNCWHGGYGPFMQWRTLLASLVGIELDRMEGFADDGLGQGPISVPIRWDTLEPRPLFTLLNHSDCDGEIKAADCGPLADDLETLLPRMEEWRIETKQFIDGLRLAASRNEPVEFR